ncbi:MAG: hypothetical protein IJU95_06475, partial [Treponema sp.]|nr:hypothetical protein [Treponema sp.]
MFPEKFFKLPVKITVISLCLLLHIIEFSPLISARHGRYTATQEYTNPLEQSQELASVLDEKKFSHICIASPLEGEELYGIAQFAMKNKMTVNRFWTVHQIGREEEEEILRQNLSSPQEGSIFLFKKEDESICRKYKLTQLEINGQYILGVPK